MELYESASEQLVGPIDFRHTWIDFTNIVVNKDGQQKKTCKPAMGYR